MRMCLGKPSPTTIKILFDSGASSSIAQKEIVKKLRIKKEKSTEWENQIGTFKTSEKCKVQFFLPELYESRLIEWNIHVTEQKSKCDLIIGQDLMTELGIIINFKKQCIKWDDTSIPIKSMDATFENSFHLEDSGLAKDATERMNKILDAKYVPADLEEIVELCIHLDEEEQSMLLSF